MQKLAAYCRVSTDDQMEKGTIEAQVTFAEKYCDLHQLPLLKIYKDDGITGTLPLQDRSAGSELLQDAKNGLFDTLLVYKLDRLGRATRVILNAIYDLEGLGVKLKSMTEPFDTGDASGRFLLTILAGVADLERSNILDRMWHGANRAAREGNWLGGIVPYGYELVDKKLSINEVPIEGANISEASVIRLIYKLTTEQHMSTIRIAEYLNALCIPPSYVARKNTQGGKRKTNTAGIWRPGRILNILRSETYKGIHVYGKRSQKERELIVREVPAIIDTDVWDRAQEVIQENYIDAFRNKKYNYLLRSLIKCGVCGLHFHGTTSSEKGSYYRCNGIRTWVGSLDGRCPNKSVPKQWLEDYVWNDCLAFIQSPELIINKIENNDAKIKEIKNSIEVEKTIINKCIEEKEFEKQSILDLFRKRLISSADIEKQLTKIALEKNTLEKRASELEYNLIKVNISSAQRENAVDMLNNLKEKIINSSAITFELKREIIRILIDNIVINTTLTDNGKQKTVATINYKFGVDDCTDMDS